MINLFRQLEESWLRYRIRRLDKKTSLAYAAYCDLKNESYFKSRYEAGDLLAKKHTLEIKLDALTNQNEENTN